MLVCRDGVHVEVEQGVGLAPQRQQADAAVAMILLGEAETGKLGTQVTEQGTVAGDVPGWIATVAGHQAGQVLQGALK